METSAGNGCFLDGQELSSGAYVCGDFFCIKCVDGQLFDSDDMLRESTQSA